MTTNELMRHLLTDISEEDQRHLVEVVDRNHAEQLARKRHALESTVDVGEQSAADSDSWVDDGI